MGGVPRRPTPCAQKTEANLSTFVQVRVEPDPTTTRSLELHCWRDGGVVVGQEDVKNEAAICIGRVCWTNN